MKPLKKSLFTQIANTRVLFIFCLISACSSGDGGDAPIDPVKEIKEPTAATLVFPEANSECTEGTINNATESTINFQWNASKHTDSYNLQVKDLITGTVTSYSTSENNYAVKLKRGNPYSWYIVSRSNKTSKTGTSATWKFFNAGEGVSSYAPFPAEAVSPISGTNVTNGIITLEWTASDVDNDIENYNVNFGEVNPPAEFQTEVTGTTLNNITVEANKTYYWSVTTKDSQGNVSYSEIFSFNGI
ncbi:hypothetical protein [Hwangdonia lutea]|uniref:Fibronectin type-III domain-containing protein n=1 Tax=Hwangdonia lutea TaxID=3075823 RepID=A0AA97EPF6_9FLAO|nr:hypothetical protein [Hwangdonia sp. SCSIO 19198]WOD44135.1 hypothetical protein RNZ46_02470 [Hwangdonia sp. SCSIO 19198]